MKKIFGIALVLAVLATLVFGSVALADDPTEVEVNWDGSGDVGATVNSGDAETNFSTGGLHISGHFTAKDFNDNPYNYGVDTFSTYLNAEVAGSGYIDYWTDRLASKESMYGPPGQGSWNYLAVEDGWGAMAATSRTNFAQQEDSLYGKPWTSNNHHIEAIADFYYMDRGVNASDGDYAEVWAWGSGSTWLNCMGSRYYATSLNFGWGDGCYTNAKFHAEGTGTFGLYGEGDRGVTFNNIMMSGASSGSLNWNGTLDMSSLPTLTATDAGSGASLQIIANFISTFDMGNYSTTAW